jgi:hypothetical protein
MLDCASSGFRSIWDACEATGVHHVGVWSESIPADAGRISAGGWTLAAAARAPRRGPRRIPLLHLTDRHDHRTGRIPPGHGSTRGSTAGHSATTAEPSSGRYVSVARERSPAVRQPTVRAPPVLESDHPRASPSSDRCPSRRVRPTISVRGAHPSGRSRSQSEPALVRVMSRACGSLRPARSRAAMRKRSCPSTNRC